MFVATLVSDNCQSGSWSDGLLVKSIAWEDFMISTKQRAGPCGEAHYGLVAEVARRLLPKLRYATADPCVLRDVVQV